MEALSHATDAVLATVLKDLTAYRRQWKTVLTSLVMPATYILVALLGSVAVGRNPIALVVEDRGEVAAQVAQAIVVRLGGVTILGRNERRRNERQRQERAIFRAIGRLRPNGALASRS